MWEFKIERDFREDICSSKAIESIRYDIIRIVEKQIITVMNTKCPLDLFYITLNDEIGKMIYSRATTELLKRHRVEVLVDCKENPINVIFKDYANQTDFISLWIK